MKKGFKTEEAAKVPCTIMHQGKPLRLMLNHLTAGDIDEADRKYPRVKPPVLLGDDGKAVRDALGRPLLDETDAPYITAAIEREINRAGYLAALALGPEAFEAREIDEQIKELRRSGDGYSRMAIVTIRDVALADAELTPEKQEAAKDGVRPTGSEG